jgi:hypothetical protein
MKDYATAYKAVKDALRAWRMNPQTSNDELTRTVLHAVGIEQPSHTTANGEPDNAR